MKNKLQKLKGGHEKKMKTIGMFMATIMVFSLFAGTGIVLAQGNNQDSGTGEGYDGSSVISVSARGASFAKANNVALAERSTVSAVDAVREFQAEEGVLNSNSLNDAISEVESSISENGRKVGFYSATYGQGYYMNDDEDHLGLVQSVWVSALVTESDDALDAVIKARGKLQIDGVSYRLIPSNLDGNSAEFELTSNEGTRLGELSLEEIASYDDGTRRIWEGKVVLDESQNGEIHLVTVTRSIRQVTDSDNSFDQNDQISPGTNMPYEDEETSEGNGPGEPVTGGSEAGFFGRIVNFFSG